MRRPTIALLAVLAVMSPAAAAPNAASTAFTRAANSPTGHAALDISVDVTAGAESWRLTGMDVVPFYYEQGMAATDDGVVFSSRNSLTRTTQGCPSWADPFYGGCYDVLEENVRPIPGELMARGFNHVGGIDIGTVGPGADVVFAPLETDNPRTARAYGAYDLQSLQRIGLLVEDVAHRYNSWVAVDPSGRYLVAGEDRFDPLRVYEITRSGDAVTLARVTALDIMGTNPAAIANFQGCKFAGAQTLYCSGWRKRNTYFDDGSEVTRVDLSAPVGTLGATATATRAFGFRARTRAPELTANIPYGLEAEDIAFWDGQLHVHIRGEAIGWVRVLHFSPI